MDHAGYMRCPEPEALRQLFKMNWDATLPAALRGEDVNRHLVVMDANHHWFEITGSGGIQLRAWKFGYEVEGDIEALSYPVQVRGTSR